MLERNQIPMQPLMKTTPMNINSTISNRERNRKRKKSVFEIVRCDSEKFAKNYSKMSFIQIVASNVHKIHTIGISSLSLPLFVDRILFLILFHFPLILFHFFYWFYLICFFLLVNPQHTNTTQMNRNHRSLNMKIVCVSFLRPTKSFDISRP